MPGHARHIPPENTIAVKGLTAEQVQPVKEFAAEFTSPLGIFVHVDRADKNMVRWMLYCNYKSMHDAKNAKNGLCQFLLQTLSDVSEFHQVMVRVPPAVCMLVCVRLTRFVLRAWAPAQVIEKSALLKAEPLFSVCLSNLPPSFSSISKFDNYMSTLMPKSLSGIAVYHPKTKGTRVMFVRFDKYAAAKELLRLSDAGKLRAEGCVMHAAPARNTAFVVRLTQAMYTSQSAAWTLEQVRVFVRGLRTIDWPPMDGYILSILRSVPAEFALDESENKVYRVHGSKAPPAASASTPVQKIGAPQACAKLPYEPPATPVHSAESPQDAAVAALDLRSFCGAQAPTAQDSGVHKQFTPLPWLPRDATQALAPAAAISEDARTMLTDSSFGHLSVPSILEQSRFAFANALQPCYGPLNKGAIGLWLGASGDGADLERTAHVMPPSPCISESMLEQSRFAFANAQPPCYGPRDKGAIGLWLGASGDGADLERTAHVMPPSPCLSTSTEIKPEDSRSMCSQALTDANPMRAWGVEQVVEFFERLGFAAAAVRDGSVDGNTLLQKFEEEDVDFFTQPPPDGLGLTKLQFKGRLRTELQRSVPRGSEAGAHTHAASTLHTAGTPFSAHELYK